jgi:hypothetical protein
MAMHIQKNGMEKELCVYSHVVREMFESTGEVAISEDLVPPQNLVDFANVDLSRSPMGVMAAADALNATAEWYVALSTLAPVRDVGEVGWEMLHHVLMAKAAQMTVPDSLLKAAWSAAARVKGREDAKRALELMGSAGVSNKTPYDGPAWCTYSIEKYPMGSVIVELLGSAMADGARGASGTRGASGEMADAERAIAAAKAMFAKEEKPSSFDLTKTVLSNAGGPEHLEQALRLLDHYRKPVDDEKPPCFESNINIDWYNHMWTACNRFAKHNGDLPFILRVIVDQFVNVSKHNTLGFLMHLLCGRLRMDNVGADKGLARLLATLPGVEDADMCDAVQALRKPMSNFLPFPVYEASRGHLNVSAVTLEDVLPLLEWAETHKAAATARHIVEMALQEDDLEILDRAVAVWRLKATGKRRR